jgi:hypothetical protein
MLNKKDVSYLLEIVSQNLPQILDIVGFDCTVKEPGHSFGERVEEELVKVLVNSNPELFSPPKVKKGGGKQTRKMEDFLYKNHYVNIKFSYKKEGQPNMVSFNRLCDKYLTEEIDSYYIFSIDANGNKVCMFNLYEQLDYTNTDLGTGQTMLSKKKFYDSFDQDRDYTVSRKDVIIKLSNISKTAYSSLIQRREEQELSRQQNFNDKLKLL